MFRLGSEHQDNKAHLNDLIRQAQREQLAARFPSSHQLSFVKRVVQFLLTRIGRGLIFYNHSQRAGSLSGSAPHMRVSVSPAPTELR